MATMNISLPQAMKAHVEAQVAGGRYASASDYIRELVRDDQRRRDALVALLVESEQEGGAHEFGDILAEAREHFRSRAA